MCSLWGGGGRGGLGRWKGRTEPQIAREGREGGVSKFSVIHFDKRG